jgi:hypothetical protein
MVLRNGSPDAGLAWALVAAPFSAVVLEQNSSTAPGGRGAVFGGKRVPDGVGAWRRGGPIGDERSGTSLPWTIKENGRKRNQRSWLSQPCALAQSWLPRERPIRPSWAETIGNQPSLWISLRLFPGNELKLLYLEYTLTNAYIYVVFFAKN